MTVGEAARQLGKSRHAIMEWVRRKDDPLRAVLPPGAKQGIVIKFSDLAEWLSRNGTSIG